MACAGITKPSPQSGHVRRAVVPPFKPQHPSGFHKQSLPGPFKASRTAPLFASNSTARRSLGALSSSSPFSPVRPSSELLRQPSSQLPRIARLPPRLGPFCSSALPRPRTLPHLNKLRRCLSSRRRQPHYHEPYDLRPFDRGPCTLGT